LFTTPHIKEEGSSKVSSHTSPEEATQPIVGRLKKLRFIKEETNGKMRMRLKEKRKNKQTFQTL
jgi:hypothetical protein